MTTCLSELNLRKPLEHGWKREVVPGELNVKNEKHFMLVPAEKYFELKMKSNRI